MILTKHVAARLSHLNIAKIGRYFDKPTYRQLLQAIIKTSEDNPYIREKIKQAIKEGKK